MIQKKLIYSIAQESVLMNLKQLYHNDEYEEQVIKYYSNKLKSVMIILIVGVILTGFVSLYIRTTGEISADGYIVRNGYGKGDKSIRAEVYRDNSDIPEEITINVSEKRFSEEEIFKMSKIMDSKIVDHILEKNANVDYVTEDLNFSKSIDGCPFTFSYMTDKPYIIDNTGKINAEKLKEIDNENEGVIVGITVTKEYYDFFEDVYFPVCVYRKKATSEELFKEVLLTEVDLANMESTTKDRMKLPSVVAGRRVYYSEQNQNTIGLLILVFTIMVFVIFFGKDADLKKDIEKRNKEMLNEYSSIVSKFALFYNAGMPVKNIWNLICFDYVKSKDETGINKQIYEEMLICNVLMKEGKGEIEAYEEFSSRVNLQCYRNLVSILSQAITKGKKDTCIVLLRESEKSFQERKLMAKKLCEEASTKLLVPLFMMLFVVIVMIIFPAFYSFRIS